MDARLVRLVRRRARSACEYCHMPHQFDELPFEIDHVIPSVHGGRTIAGNLALSCFCCNRFKGPNLAGVDPKTRKLSRLFNPRRHAWHRHFRWDGPRLVGRTAIRRATVRVLKINELLRVRLRAELIAEGALVLD